MRSSAKGDGGADAVGVRVDQVGVKAGRDVMASHRFLHIGGEEIIEADRTAARGPCGEQLFLAVIEGKREDGQRAVFGGKAEAMPTPRRAR